MTPWRALKGILRRREIDREIDEELRFHLERKTADNVAAGMPPDAAARAARRSFGNYQSVREECRDVRGASIGEALLQDVRYGVRGLRNSPGFTTVAVLSLALGIGATTTVFSLIDAALLRPLPVPDADRLVTVHKPSPQGSRIHVISYPDYLDYKEHRGAFSDVLAWTEADASLKVDDRAEQAYGALVSGNYFSMLGVTPALGRLLAPDDDRTPGAHPVVVISSSLWQSRFGGDPSVVGRTLKLNGHIFTVIGVTPKTFTSTYGVFAPSFYAPLAMQGEVLSDPERFGSRLSRYLKVTGRLAPGVSRKQAEAALSLLDRQLEEAHPEESRDAAAPPPGLELDPIGSFPGDIRLGALGVAGLLFAIVGFVLLIACANVAGMLLARATVRQHEMAVRLALGATRGRLIRQLLTESTVLFCAAGALGVGLTAVMTRWLSTIALPAAVPFALDVAIDGRVLVFALLLALATGTLFGLAPALEAARANLQYTLKDAPAAPGARRARLRQVFVVGQLALSLVLLVGAGLAGRALQHAQTIYPGREPETVWVAALSPAQLGYDLARARETYRRIAERVETLPGVEVVSFAREISIGGGYARTSLTVEGEELQPECASIAPGYFRTLGIVLLEGRDFTATDREGAPRVVIVNETMARRFWPGASAVGRRVSFGEGESAEIVGVVQNGRHRIAGQAQPPFVYASFLQTQNLDTTLVWRQRGAGASAVAAVRREVEAIDPDLAIEPMTLLAAVRQVTIPWRLAGALAGGFGLLGLLLAVLGVYGLVSYTFRQRTQEIGVRIALGARRRDVFRLVMMQGLKLALLGVCVGAALALGLTQALSELLFGVRAGDLVTYAGVALLLVLVALVACWLPAHRAARVDPVTALRRG